MLSWMEGSERAEEGWVCFCSRRGFVMKMKMLWVDLHVLSSQGKEKREKRKEKERKEKKRGDVELSNVSGEFFFLSSLSKVSIHHV